MADYEENEDDLFADLYDGEDSGLGPTPTAAPAVTQIKTEPDSAPSPQADAPQDSIANGSDPSAYGTGEQNDGGAYGDGQAYDQGYNGQTGAQDSQSWGNNQPRIKQEDLQSWGNNQPGIKQEEGEDDNGGEHYDRPIGIKEDG